jgi:putative ABC transport system ATP-binding protein
MVWPDDRSPVLDVQEVTKTYVDPSGDLVRAIGRVSFQVARGELVAVYGPSGSGKTTLLKVLSRVLPPTSGRVLVDGHDIAGLRGRALNRYRRDTLGVVLQGAKLTPGWSVLRNTMLRLMERGARWGDAREQVLPLLQRLELSHRLDHLPDRLSPGERVRVALAMALSTGPRLLLADEPTGGLDSRGGRSVLNLLSEFCRDEGVAAVVTTHDPATRSIAQRSFTLHDGLLVPDDGELAHASDRS